MPFPTWLVYFIITMLVSVPLYLQIRREGGAEGEKFTGQFRRLLLIPGLVAFAIRLVTKLGFGDIFFGLGRVPWLLLAALFAPPFIEFALIISVRMFSMAQVSREIIAYHKEKVHINPGVQLLLGTEPQHLFKFIANLLLTVALGSLAMAAFTLFEEFGWRGYLQGQLIDSFGLVWGVVVGGILWGIWYMPLVLMGYQFPDYRRLGAFVYMPIYTIALGIVLGWLYWLSGSIWVPALLNAAVKVSGLISSNALGDAGNSRGVRMVWLWLWAMLGGFALVLWHAGG